MKADKLRKMSISELESELGSMYRECFNFRVQRAVGSLTKHHLIREARHNIARIKIILSEKNRMASEDE